MIVLCAFRAVNPHEMEMAIGGGAGTLEVVTASVLLRQEGERRLADGWPLEGRGATGQVRLPDDSEMEVVEGDSIITVAWPGDDINAAPELDCCYSTPPTAYQLLTAALMLKTYAWFPVWESRMDRRLNRQAADLAARQAEQRDREAGRRVAAAMVGEAPGPVDLDTYRKGR